MTTVTKKQIIDFINSQPADRPVDMFNPNSNDRCGCVMVHYGREILNIEENFTCGYYQWKYKSSGASLAILENYCAINVIIKNWESFENYGDIQKYLLSVDKPQ